MKKNDRRVKKTKRALQLALANLMVTKNLDTITIQELVDLADIHRATFYSHYSDIYDLYTEMENDVMFSINQLLENEGSQTYEDIYSSIIDFVYENSAFVVLLFSNNVSNAKFQNHISELIENKYIELWRGEQPQITLSDEIRYVTAYHVQGSLAVISKWIKNDFKYPKEKLINLIRSIDDNVDSIMLSIKDK